MQNENIITNVDVVVPDWVRWIATDDDGTVFGYKEKPYQNDQLKFWQSNEDDVHLYLGEQPDDWTLTLHEWK